MKDLVRIALMEIAGALGRLGQNETGDKIFELCDQLKEQRKLQEYIENEVRDLDVEH